MRRLAATLAATAAICGTLGYGIGSIAIEQPAPRRVAVNATKFDFDRTEIRVRQGEAIILVLSARDFVHGFAVPDFNVRADLIPGTTVELTVRPDRPGRYVFLCDNFCGEGHDRMSGVIIVTSD